jgi:Histone methylation protein DOT1
MPLTITLRDEILTDIDTFDKDPNLYREKNFNNRVQAIDFIEFHIIERINALVESGVIPDYFQDLKQHAEKLRCRLVNLNTCMFSTLRSKIAAGTYRGSNLMNLIEEYLDGHVPECVSQHVIGYDNLDIFMNGILGSQKLPTETRDREPDMVYYQKTPARIILEIIKRATLRPHDVFIDLGSGLGQVAILMHLLTGIPAIGVEFEPAFCDYARSCAAELNVHNVEFININARYADYSSGTVFFLYTPFEGKMLQDVLNTLRTEAKERKIKLFTYGPCTPVVAQQDWLLDKSEMQYGPGVLGEFINF